MRRNSWQLLVALGLAPLLWMLFALTPLDRILIAPYYDGQAHAFPLRDAFFMQDVLHSGLKLVVVGIGIMVLGAFLLTFIVPQWVGQRRRLLWLFSAMVLASLLVSVLKQTSTQHCPWDLADYGGYAPYSGLFDALPAGITAGKCFPGGHAAGGFALIAFYFALRDVQLRYAQLGLAGGLLLGSLMGWAQMMRGAHFLSHNLWSAWVVWACLAVYYQLLPPQPH